MSDVAAAFARCDAAAIVARGRELGLAIAGLHETPPGDEMQRNWAPASAGEGGCADAPPLVVDLSALWAGPLAANLLQLAGATVVKVESRRRPDVMRGGDPALFARLNGGKASIAIDLHDAQDRAALLRLIGQAQVVVEAARPRALAQLGIDAAAIVAATPGLVWITITGHGDAGAAADWVAFGDDAGIAGGLSAELFAASGTVGFVGDAIADPLTGLHAARVVLEQRRSGRGAWIVLSMRGVVAAALADERGRDREALHAALHGWAGAVGRPFPAVPSRAAGSMAVLGADTAQWLC